MTDEYKLDKKGQSHYEWCKFFLYIAGAILIGYIVIAIINIIYLCIQPDTAINLEETDFGYRFDLLIGYANCSYENLLTGAKIISSKVFSITYLSLLAVLQLPVLLLLNYIRKILNTIKTSHSPLVKEVADYTRKVGVVLVLMGFFSTLILQMGIAIFAFHTIHFKNPINFIWIFAGMIILLFSDIFRRGCDLQQFSDETL